MIIFIMKHITSIAYNHFFNVEIVCSIYKFINSPLQNTYNNALNIITDLCCCKQTMYKVAEIAFFLFFLSGLYGRGCS